MDPYLEQKSSIRHGEDGNLPPTEFRFYITICLTAILIGIAFGIIREYVMP